MVRQVTLWLQGLFLFSLVWTVGGTIMGDSKLKFDVFFRTLISGVDNEHPKPKSIKITKVGRGGECKVFVFVTCGLKKATMLYGLPDLCVSKYYQLCDCTATLLIQICLHRSIIE